MGWFDTTEEWDEALEAWEGIGPTPAKRNRKRRYGFQVLKNGFLEKYFGTSHWIMPGVWFLPLITWCVYEARASAGLGWGTLVGLFFVGVIAWTLIEYALHRFFFHLPPGKSEFRRTLLFTAHGYHHEFPDDPGRLVAPPALSWPIGALLALLCWGTLGVYWQAVLGGIYAGYLGYDWMHYYTHHGRPKSKMLKFMRRFHMEHHYKDHETRFGLSSPLWDVILRSYGRPEAPTKIEMACRNGEGEGGDPPLASPQ